MTISLLKKGTFIAVGVSLLALAATSHVAGQAPAAPGAQAPAGQGGGRRGGGAGAGQAPAAPGAPAGAQGGGGRGGGGRAGGGAPRLAQGGTGPVKVMVITKGHPFDPRERFFAMFDAMGSDITWTHAEHPAADVMMSPKYGSAYDAFVFYDLGGPGGTATTPDGKPVDGFLASNSRTYPNPSAQLKEDFKNLLRQGKGMVFLHHAAAALGAHVARVLGSGGRRLRLVRQHQDSRHRHAEPSLRRHDAAAHHLRGQDASHHAGTG